MMTIEEAEEIMTSIVEFDERLKALEQRAEIAEESITYMRNEKATMHDVREAETRAHDRIDVATDLLKDVIGLPPAELNQKGKLGTRITQIETDLKTLKSTYGEDLKLFSDTLIEVKDQVSNPASKITAVERLRNRVKESRDKRN